MSMVEGLSETGGSYKYQKSERKTEDDSLLQTVIPLEQLEFFLDWRRVPAHQVTQLDDVELDAVRHVRECAVLLLLCYCNRYRRTLQRQTVNRLLATSSHLKSLCMGQCQHQKKHSVSHTQNSGYRQHLYLIFPLSTVLPCIVLEPNNLHLQSHWPTSKSHSSHHISCSTVTQINCQVNKFTTTTTTV